MKCNYCGMELNNKETVCPNCGGPVQTQQNQQKQFNSDIYKQFIKQQFSNERQCYKVAYILLAISFGIVGIHDFYAKYYLRGVIKLVLTLTVIGIYISFIWSIIDVFKIRQTKDGKIFI